LDADISGKNLATAFSIGLPAGAVAIVRITSATKLSWMNDRGRSRDRGLTS
jgi:hypothetical protein